MTDLPLAVLLVGSARARFVDSYPVEALIDGLRPVEAAFLAAVVDQGDETFGWNSSEVLDPIVQAHLPPRIPSLR